MVKRVSLVLGYLSIAGCGTESASVAQPAPLVQDDLSASRAREIAGNVAKTRTERVAALRQVLAPRLNRSGEGLEREVLANGQRAIKLQGRFGHAAVARKRPDGSLEHSCFSDADAATRFLLERGE